MRRKPMFNNLRLTYVDVDGYEHTFYCNELSNTKDINTIIMQPIKDGGSRFITDADIDFEIDGEIIQGEETKRITELPEIKPMKDNNSRRGIYRKVKVIVTT